MVVMGLRWRGMLLLVLMVMVVGGVGIVAHLAGVVGGPGVGGAGAGGGGGRWGILLDERGRKGGRGVVGAQGEGGHGEGEGVGVRGRELGVVGGDGEREVRGGRERGRGVCAGGRRAVVVVLVVGGLAGGRAVRVVVVVVSARAAAVGHPSDSSGRSRSRCCGWTWLQRRVLDFPPFVLLPPDPPKKHAASLAFRGFSSASAPLVPRALVSGNCSSQRHQQRPPLCTYDDEPAAATNIINVNIAGRGPSSSFARCCFRTSGLGILRITIYDTYMYPHDHYHLHNKEKRPSALFPSRSGLPPSFILISSIVPIDPQNG
ncbi:hypothetical protein BOTBODRAFT_358416 [Botryobasidium botryosum FD-172 SS1]|uniref:Uncharacterized protein n=1 Tax=Botryobasidium botryosum (strain FD-172 SS1) TaxID=930990 RepID=A0A067MES2_BOTB1|nr:hypothetical protein BOTBODRAFT_358416 [Botryobasidium botryosum FD-172 SS1]